jgi:hypothetical protein
MTPQQRARALHGRTTERRVLQDLLVSARGGQGRALIVRGSAGVGKTALLDELRNTATDFTVLMNTGVESDLELAYAGLQQLCAPVMSHIEELAGPQRDALRQACGLEVGPAPDRFLVGLAVLGLLDAASRDKPVLCVIDDVHWLDHASAQTLFFTARRLLAERVAVLFGLRHHVEGIDALPELRIDGLPDRDARDRAFPGDWTLRWPSGSSPKPVATPSRCYS